MLAVMGLLLAVFGFFSDPIIYEKSLGININLLWGCVLIGLASVLLWLGSRKDRN
jgi:hypothetical protein